MKRTVYWLMGDRAGRTLVATWNWLWGIPVESGGKIAVEAAQESIEVMQRTVRQLTQSVARVTATYQRAKEKYEEKVKEYHQFEQQAIVAKSHGHLEAARLAMNKAILVEQLLPQLQEQVAKAEQMATTCRERLHQEQHRLETYRVYMQNLKDQSEVTEALAAITRINGELQGESARSQFDTAQAAIQRRYLQINAEVDLSEAPNHPFATNLEKLTLDDEITRRLEQLQASDSH
ncbi:MAG: PspA/IM30 family protein [Leptolyngbyaceae cyanobacterium bins.59]|nr:PspA/IM30 family protein [Leptolyngbyaceae cyanobacterium bins.59]